MKFDLILTNPPFQDSVNRKKTPHKLWIDFTSVVFDRLLADDGTLCQVSPASFASPSSIVLELMKEFRALVLRFGTEHHFPEVGSTFCDYAIRKAPSGDTVTRVVTAREEFPLRLDSSLMYLPNDLCHESMSIHRRVVFETQDKLPVEWDYVVAHNIRRQDPEPTLSEVRTDVHVHEVLNTNVSRWWSSVRQDWADSPKVMWSRSGYTRPIADHGVLGGTDLAYFVRTESNDEADNLAANMNLELMRYVYRTARWSGFGNERVFVALPDLPRDRVLTDAELYDRFGIAGEEVEYVRRAVAPGRRGRRPS